MNAQLQFPTQIQLRRDTAANWTSANPILALGEPGYEITSTGFPFGRHKIGDGVTAWNGLPYFSLLGIDGKVPESQIPARLSDLTLNGVYVNKPAGIVEGQVPVWNAAQAKFVAGGIDTITFVTLVAAAQAITIPAGVVSGMALTQDGFGSRTVTWPAGIRWDGGTVPVLSTQPLATDVFTFIARTAGGWFGKKESSNPSPSSVITSDSFNRANVASLNTQPTDIALGGAAITWSGVNTLGITTNVMAQTAATPASSNATLTLPATTQNIKLEFNLAAKPAGANIDIVFFDGTTNAAVIRLAPTGVHEVFKAGYGGSTIAITGGTGVVSLMIVGTAMTGVLPANDGTSVKKTDTNTGVFNFSSIRFGSDVATGFSIDDVKVSIPA